MNLMNYRCLLIKRIVPVPESGVDTTAFILTPDTTIGQINDIIEWFGKKTVLSVELTTHYTTATAIAEVEKTKKS